MSADPEVEQELTTLIREIEDAQERLTAAQTVLAILMDLLDDEPDPDPDPDPEPEPEPTGPPEVVSAEATPGATDATVKWSIQGDVGMLDRIGLGLGREPQVFLSFREFPPDTRQAQLTNLAPNSNYTAEILLRYTSDNGQWDRADRVKVPVHFRTKTNGPGPNPNPDPNPNPNPTPTGRFSAKDGVIIDPEGRPFTPNGCNAVGGDSWSVWWGFNLHESMEDMIGVYGMNFARWIHTERGDLAHHPWVGNIGNQDALVEQARQRKFLLMLTNFDNHPGHGPGLDIGWAVEKMGRLAKRYAGNPYVCYSPWNEPTEPGYGPADINEWRRVTYPVVDAILNANPSAFVILGGDHYGQEASNQDVRSDSVLIRLAPELIQRYGDRVAGDIHVYARWWDQDRNDEQLRQYFRALKQAGLPIVVGETGALDSWPQNGLRQALDRLYRVCSEPEFAHVGISPWCNGWGDFLDHSDHQWGSHWNWALDRKFIRLSESAAGGTRALAPKAPTARQRQAMFFERTVRAQTQLDDTVRPGG